jgi:hypothetical protein
MNGLILSDQAKKNSVIGGDLRQKVTDLFTGRETGVGGWRIPG